MMKAMEDGKIAGRGADPDSFEVQDTLITILSEKTLPIPELGDEVQASKGFNVIATANNRDKGVNELSSALRRRFNTVSYPCPTRPRRKSRSSRPRRLARPLARASASPALGGDPTPGHDLPRASRRQDRRRQDQVEIPTGTMSTAEAISVLGTAWPRRPLRRRLAQAGDLAAGLIGAVVKDPVQDRVVWQEYSRRSSRSGRLEGPLPGLPCAVLKPKRKN